MFRDFLLSSLNFRVLVHVNDLYLLNLLSSKLTRVVLQSSSLVCRQTAATLCDVGITSNCLGILKTLLEHWREVASHEEVRVFDEVVNDMHSLNK